MRRIISLALAINLISFMFPVAAVDYEGLSLADVERFASQGDVIAQTTLGERYKLGSGVKQSFEQALDWYQKAGAKGYAKAQFALGHMYSTGWGVTQDNRLAVDWYSKAADQGHIVALINLGQMYSQGRGVPQDRKRGAALLSLAAQQGDGDALVMLADKYMSGDGVPKDPTLAYMCVLISADHGNLLGRQNSKAYSALLTPNQIEEGRTLASKWKIGMLLVNNSANSSTTELPR